MLRHDSSENRLAAERMLARLANDPTDRIEPTDPIDPIESADPTDPIDRTDPTESTDSTEPRDRIDSTEPVEDEVSGPFDIPPTIRRP
jgi:hypothetical protein